ncbi:hypothetical protein MJO29_009144 [Puccinia striiformis f. sp. tritici]|nr:hypothetical protein MJO29_009144 [Puccinia striiformis f. sp. tritici]
MGGASSNSPSLPGPVISLKLLRKSDNNVTGITSIYESMDRSFVDPLFRRDMDHRCLVTGTHIPILNRSGRSLWMPKPQSNEKRLQEQKRAWTQFGAPFTAHHIQPSQLASHHILLQSIDIYTCVSLNPTDFQTQQQNGLLRLPVHPTVCPEEASSAKPQEVEDKFFFGNGFNNYLNVGTGYNLFYSNSYFYNTWSTYSYNNIFAYGCFPYNSVGRYFIKASEGAQSVSRRAISLDADQLVRRADTESVTCTAAKGVSQDFSVKDCVAASHQLAEKKTSSATVGGCTLSLVNSKEKIAPGSISGHTLEKTTRQILKSCVKSVSEKEASTNDKDSLKIDQQQVVMLISHAA